MDNGQVTFPFRKLSDKNSNLSIGYDHINLENVFNKQGVCRVVAQIILSIFSLNTKESGKLNDIGKIEASRAVIAYMTSWTAK